MPENEDYYKLIERRVYLAETEIDLARSKLLTLTQQSNEIRQDMNELILSLSGSTTLGLEGMISKMQRMDDRLSSGWRWFLVAVLVNLLVDGIVLFYVLRIMAAQAGVPL